jgi:predicted anti-sigma-YlaC factor YlaD
MDRECAGIRELLVDEDGRRGRLPPEVSEHVASCPGCRDFAAFLEGLSGPSAADREISHGDYLAVDLALLMVKDIRRKRSGTLRFACFLVLAVAWLSGLALMGASGYGIWVLGLQAAVFLILPFLGLAILWRRAQGDAQWT